MPPFNPLGVLLEVRDGPPLDIEKHRIVSGVVTQEGLEVAVELADTGHERGEVVLDLREHEMDPRRALVGLGTGEQVGKIGQPIADRVEDGRLQADRTAELVVGVEHAADRRLTATGQRPLEVLAFEVLRRRVRGRVVLRRLQQPPSGELMQHPLEGAVVGGLVPADRVDGTSYLIDVERRSRHGRLLEGRHHRGVQITAVGRREPEQVSIEAPPDPSMLHAQHATRRV